MFTKKDLRQAIAWLCREIVRLLDYAARLYLLAFVVAVTLTLTGAPVKINLLDMVPLLGPAVAISLAAAAAEE